MSEKELRGLASPSRFFAAASASLTLCLSLPSLGVAQSVGTVNVKNVVVVYSHESVLPANVIVDRMLRENMRVAGEWQIEIYSEYLDTARFSSGEHLDRSMTYLKEKYSDLSVDLLIAGGYESLNFLMSQRDDLFPDSQLLYCCVDSDRVEADKSLANLPGVQMRVDPVSTLKLAKALQPDAKRLFVITGASDFDHSLKLKVQTRLSAYPHDFQIEYFSGLTLEELLQRVRQIPAGAIVLFLLNMQDGDGQHLFSPEVLQQVAERSAAPVYGIFSTFHGKGIVGGNFATFEDLGKETAELGLQILCDADPSKADPSEAAAFTHAPARNHLDWRQMRRWGLDPSRLPSGSVVDFRELSAWERYPGRIVAAITIIGFQTALIAMLVVQIRQRRIAEQLRLASQHIAQRQRDELARVNRLTTVGELSTSIAHEVNQPLAAIVSNAQAAMRLLRQSPSDTEEVASALHDIANDGNRAAGILNRVRSLVRKEQPISEPLELNEEVREVLRIAAPDAENRGVVIHQEFDDALPLIIGDKIAIQQVILNLLNNAAQAMQDVNPESRQITVRTTHDARFVRLTIEDGGVGLADDQLPRIFDPFFTTRSGGIGMGLSISQSIIESHEGKIWATQNADRGATFHVRFPIPSPDALDLALSGK